MYSTNIILANLIFLFHIIILLFVILIPFTKIPLYLILHITFCISLIIHWAHNNNACSLTLIESKLRGISESDSFSYKFIAPIYDISKTEWSNFCYIITIILALISLYYLIISPKWKDFNECIRSANQYITQNNKLTLKEKIYIYFTCIVSLY